jgi:serine/threonine-protein kinase
MGTVYLCRVTGEAGFRRLFALKVLRHRIGADPAIERAFLREAYVASRLHHPNAVAVVDAAIHARQPYLVLEYVEGCSLATLLQRNLGARPPALVAAIVIDALEGLAAAHALTDDDGRPLGLVHGDVSPENVLVGVDGAARISDFGVSRLGRLGASEDPWEPLLSRAGYVAPERALGRASTPQADVFSMGVVLWSALTGHDLFHGASAEETLENVRACRVPPRARSACARRPASTRSAWRRSSGTPIGACRAPGDGGRAPADRPRHQLIAGRSDVSRWVREHFRRELEQRRLAILDAARGTPASSSAPALPAPCRWPPSGQSSGGRRRR